jgi:hypothetical protein
MLRAIRLLLEQAIAFSWISVIFRTAEESFPVDNGETPTLEITWTNSGYG